jgi:hypothetical protein
MPSAFMTRRGKMGEEGEKEKVVANFKEAFEQKQKGVLGERDAVGEERW